MSARQGELIVITCRFRNRFARVTFIGRTAVYTVQRVRSELRQIILLRDAAVCSPWVAGRTVFFFF